MISLTKIREHIYSYSKVKRIYDLYYSNTIDYGEAYFCTLREERR